MKHHLFLSLIAVSLLGCGVGDRLSPVRPILIERDFICFSGDKDDVLSSYQITSLVDDKHKKFASVTGVALRYPDTCLKMTLPRGYIFSTIYNLNGKYYQYNFFIDNNGKILGTSGGD